MYPARKRLRSASASASVKISLSKPRTRNNYHPSTYEIKCKYCKSDTHYSDFHKFIEHASEKHSNIALSALTLVPTEPAATNEKEMNFDEIPIELVNDEEIDDCYTDLYSLPSNCVMDVINVLNRCFCIWHLPSRETMTMVDRFTGYCLIAEKLKQFKIKVPLSVVQKIVFQLQEYFFEKSPMSLAVDKADDDIVIENLLFLVDDTDQDKTPNSLFILKNCPFCGQHFTNNISQWKHLKAHHLPNNIKEKLKKLLNVQNQSSPLAKQKAIPVPEALPSPEAVPVMHEAMDVAERPSAHSERKKRKIAEVLQEVESSPISLPIASTDGESSGLTLQSDMISASEGLSSTNDPSSTTTSEQSSILENQKPIDSAVPKPLYCNLCCIQYKRERMYMNHMMRYHPPTICKLCSVDFRNPDILTNHIFNNHEMSKSCPICCDSQSDWMSEAHLSMHFFNRQCPICKNVIIDAQSFKRHKRTCLKQSRYKCIHCDASFTGKLPLRRHTITFHNDPDPFKCNRCNECFKHFVSYHNHVSQDCLH